MQQAPWRQRYRVEPEPEPPGKFAQVGVAASDTQGCSRVAALDTWQCSVLHVHAHVHAHAHVHVHVHVHVHAHAHAQTVNPI